MAKLILTLEEEFGYIHQLDRIREIMPDIEIVVLPQSPTSSPRSYYQQTTDLGGEFKEFLKGNGLSYENAVAGTISKYENE
jgi:hypothetical protein